MLHVLLAVAASCTAAGSFSGSLYLLQLSPAAGTVAWYPVTLNVPASGGGTMPLQLPLAWDYQLDVIDAGVLMVSAAGSSAA